MTKRVSTGKFHEVRNLAFFLLHTSRPVISTLSYLQLYYHFVVALKSTALDKLLVKYTAQMIKDMAFLPELRTSVTQRNILKQLGRWIGRMTIGRNEPLRYNHLALRPLLLRAYSSGQLVVVLSVVTEILMFTKDSQWLRYEAATI